ncbi:uncharacterized protein LOC143478249 isoform X1 [Brachyhypopomus gauderio]
MIKEKEQRKQEKKKIPQQQSPHFYVDDRVLRFNARKPQRKGGKQEKSWLGPFTVTAIEGKSADIIDDKGVEFKKINIDLLKHYREDVPHVPHRIHSSKVQTRLSASSTVEENTALQGLSTSLIDADQDLTVQGESSTPLPAADQDLTVQGESSSPLPAADESTAQAVQSGVDIRNTSDRIHNSVQEAWSGKNCYVLLSKVGPYKIFYSDIERFCPGKELESEVINAYLTILVKEHNKCCEEEAFLVDSFAMTAIWNSKFQRIKWDPSRYKIILGVVNDHHHWFLVVIYPNERKTILLDSMGESKLKLRHCLERTRAFMRKKGMPVSRWRCETLPHPLQQDGTSCGVFALKFAEQVLAAKPMMFAAECSSVDVLRWEMATTLLRESDDISSLCHFCGEMEAHDDLTAETLWIACDRCGRWFHTTCVKNPPLDNDYVCTACI